MRSGLRDAGPFALSLTPAYAGRMPGLYDPTGPERTPEEHREFTLQTYRDHIDRLEKLLAARHEKSDLYETFLRRLLMKLRDPKTTRASMRDEIEGFRSAVFQGQRPKGF